MPKSIEKTSYWWDVQTSNRFGSYIETYEEIAIQKCMKILSATKEKTVVDFGCGSGNWSLYLLSQDKNKLRTIGIDVDNEAARIYKNRVPSSICILTSNNNKCLPLRNGTVDLIIVFQAPFINGWFLEDAKRILKPHGLLAGTVLNKSSWRGALQALKSRILRKENPFIISFAEFRKRSEKEGFELIFSKGFGWIPVFSRQNNSVLIPLFGLLERILFLGHVNTLSPNLIFILRKL